MTAIPELRRAATAFVQALLLGVLLAVPLAVWQAEFEDEIRFSFYTAPAGHDALRAWYAERRGVTGVAVAADAEGVRVRLTRRGRLGSLELPPLSELGYSLRSYTDAPSTFPVLGPRLLLLFVLSMQAGFLILGVRFRRRARAEGLALPALSGGRVSASLLLGLGAGAMLFVFGWCYDEALARLLPSTAADLSPWSELAVDQGPALVALVAAGVLLAPWCEELFFRGALFGRMAAAGHVRGGALASAVLFAAAHLDPWRTPAFIVYGLVLAAACRRTGGLLAPFVAHALNNAAAFTVLLI